MKKVGMGKCCCILALALLLQTGCQATPERGAVVSKRENGQQGEAAVSAEDRPASGKTEALSFQRSFESSDKSVQFTMDIRQSVPASALPVVQVTAHYLTEADMQRVAKALFPNGEFYEAESQQNRVLSKSEIQENLNLWSQYTNVSALRELYGDTYGEEYLTGLAELIKDSIAQYTLLYETAPEESTQTPCRWKMRKSSEYLYTGEELAGMNLDEDNDEINARCRINGIPYLYGATTRKKSDFSVNLIACMLDSGISPRSMEERVLMAKLCRTPEPTQEQMEAVQTKAAEMLTAMELGRWEIDECRLQKQQYGNQTEYTLLVNAVPVLGGTPALRCKQLDSLRNPEGYAPSQYVTDARFAFSANGELVSFTLYTPLEAEQTLAEYGNTMDMQALLERAQEVFTLTDAYAYSFGSYLQYMQEEVVCRVAITQMEYGLSRIRMENHPDGFYYVPSVVLKGNVEYVGKNSGNAYYASQEPEILLRLNAQDGTILNDTNT